MTRFLIVGGNFGNKGAQSMLFTCINEFKERFPGSESYFCTSETLKDFRNYKFDYIHVGNHSMEFERGDYRYLPKMILKGLVRKISGNKNRILEELELYRILPSINAVIDISGFALSSDFGDIIPETYFAWFDIAYRRGLPLILMPQSFGPFEFGNNQDRVDELAGKYLNYADIVFAREENSYNSIKERYDPKGLIYSPDCVLVGNFPNTPEAVFKEYNLKEPVLDGIDWVGVIPNMRTTEKKGGKEAILKRYLSVIEHLLEREKKVCVLSHSSEDIELCRRLESMLQNKTQNTHFIYDDLSCFDYDVLCRKFDFIVSSRYHSIIHAYRNSIPVIALGWAEKYRDVLTLFGQSQYMVDITDSNEETDVDVVQKIDEMIEKVGENKEEIFSNLRSIRKKSNCFDELETIVRSYL